MGCSGQITHSEHDFVAKVCHSRTDTWSCAGPLTRLAFNALGLAQLEDAFLSPVAHDLLWGGYDPEPIDAMYFTLCALHWMELACLVSIRGRQFDDAAWRMGGALLLERICQIHGWDVKEIANAFTWQTVRLT